MAYLYISEYRNLGADGETRLAPIAQEPALARQRVSFTTAASSSAFAAKTRFVRLYSDTACHVTFAASPTALATDHPLAADQEYWFGVVPGQKVSVYDGVT